MKTYLKLVLPLPFVTTADELPPSTKIFRNFYGFIPCNFHFSRVLMSCAISCVFCYHLAAPTQYLRVLSDPLSSVVCVELVSVFKTYDVLTTQE